MSDCIDKFDVTMIESKSDAYPEEWNADYERGFGDAITAVLKLPSVHPKLPENWWKTEHGYMWLCPHCGLPVHSDFGECLRCGIKRPSAQPTLRERALMLLLNWAIECGFGYDNIPEEYARYEDEIKEMGYIDGMVYIAEKEVNRND